MPPEPAHQPGFTAAVLAGGRSTRMGTDKAFLRIGGELLIARQLRVLKEAGAAELLISGRKGVDYADSGARVVYDEETDAGPLAGLVAILHAASFPIVLVLAVDMPNMTSAMLRKILAQCENNSGCVPADNEGFQPLAAAYPKTALALARQCLKDRTYAMREFASRAVKRGVARRLELEPSDRNHFANWNHPWDWPTQR
jgi:molybdopterin-guanine dinucleotide biosynthesis protein A